MTGRPEGKVTLGSQRQVLAVTRNRASVFRLLDVLKLFDNDDRVTIRTTIGPDSRYEHGVDQLLRSERIRPLPWESAVRTRFDLAVSGTTHTSLHQLRAPVVVFPHGAGHHKRPPAATSGDEVFELTPQQLLHNGSVIPTRILLPGPDSMRRLRRCCPQALPRAVIGGDPIAQQIHRHRDLRDTYRAAFGLRPGQRLLLITSSWGPGSLAAQSLDLVTRLVAELPVDEYRVAAAFHHNVTIHDGRRDLERRLGAAIESGLILLPPRASWQSALLAADAVIGDGGSISFYAAAEVPLAVACRDTADYPADGPVAALLDSVSCLDPDAELLPQVERLIVTPRSRAIASIIDSSIDRSVDAAAAFRSIMYGLMELPEPATPAFLSLSKPEVDVPSVAAFAVHATVTGTGSGLHMGLSRFPAATAPMSRDRHLVVRTDDDDPRRPQSAAALVAVNPEPELAELLRRFPGCRVTARARSRCECLLLDRDGAEYRVTVDEPIAVDVAELAASVYYGLWQARREAPNRLTVECGGETAAMTIGRSGVG